MATVGDLVLVYVEDNPAFFARIEYIEPDLKPNWYQVTLLVLQVPVIEVTWILRGEYINSSSFTMGGKKVLIEPVVAPSSKPPPDKERKPIESERRQPAVSGGKGKVISLFNTK